jgi:hypothetical protein
MPQGPNYGLQGGSTWTISDEGTMVVGAGGSIQVESGGVINVAAGGSIVNAGGLGLGAGVSLTNPAINVITLGGTTAKWAFGTVGLTSGVGTIGLPGFTRVLSANANPILGEAPGLGSFTTVMVDLSLAAAGSIIFHAGAGTLPYSNNGTVAWMAYGT